MLSDIRIALRTLVKRPAFAVTTVAVLAAGIGANSAVFGLVNQALFSPPGIAEPGRVVAVRTRYDKLNMPSTSISGPDFGDVQRERDLFEHTAVMQSNDVAYTAGGVPEFLKATSVSVAWFDVFGARAALGRTFTPEEDQPNTAPVVVLTHVTWQRLFGGDPSIIGRSITLDQKAHRVVGVMPAGYRWPREVEVWMPLRLPPVELTPDYRFNEHLLGVARLQRGVTLEAANARIRVLADRVRNGQDRAGAFARDSKWGMFAMPFVEYVAGDSRLPILVLMGAVGFVLLIACANIAGLMLARAAGRAREMAIRSALGAGHRQLLMQTACESAILACGGAVAGLALASVGMRLLLAIAPKGAAVGLAPVIDLPVVLFTAAATVMAGLLFTLAPAFRVSRRPAFDELKDTGRTATVGRGRQRMRAALVAAETALALVLLVGAGLLIRSLARLQEVSPGFETRGVISAAVALPQERRGTPETQVAFYQALLDRLAATPGVVSVGAATPLPFTGNDSSASFRIEGQDLGPGDPGPHGRIRLASPGYFAALRIPVIRGRVFTADDRLGTEPVAVIDENLARQYWPNEDPIGRRIRFGPRAITIVGIVGHVLHTDLAGETDKGTYYLCLQQRPRLGVWFVVRTRAGVMAPTSLVADAIRAVDPTLPVDRVGTMGDLVSESLATRRFVMRVLTFFAAVALLMAAIGLYGVISYSVAQRTQEIGVRMALGADRSSVLGLVLARGLGLAGVGVAIGLVGSMAGTRLLSSQLYGLSPFDPATFATMVAVLLVAALLACYLPARTATRVDPLVALRYE